MPGPFPTPPIDRGSSSHTSTHTHTHSHHEASAVVTIKNRRRVQNHIGGLHACGMALAAESATGIVVGMNVPDSAIPLCKSMKVNFVRRCEGTFPRVCVCGGESRSVAHAAA